jgi:hypothetical protein
MSQAPLPYILPSLITPPKGSTVIPSAGFVTVHCAVIGKKIRPPVLCRIFTVGNSEVIEPPFHVFEHSPSFMGGNGGYGDHLAGYLNHFFIIDKVE